MTPTAEIKAQDYQHLPSITTKFEIEESNSIDNRYIIGEGVQIITHIAPSTPEYAYGLPSELEHISEAIHSAQYIRTLQEDWDDEGGIPIPDFVFQRAIKFLKEYSYFLFDTYCVKIIAPSIMPLNDGSIDLSWEDEGAASLLVCIKNQKEEMCYYYGEFYEDGLRVDSNGEIPTSRMMTSFANSWLRNIRKNEC